MNRLIIVGAGGHGRVIADIALKIGYENICFLDDGAIGESMGFAIVGKTADIENFNDGKTDFVIGIGNNVIRRNIAEKYDVNWVTLIHPSATIGSRVDFGSGTVVMAGAAVNPCTVIGHHCIINTASVVEHDNVLEDYVHISPGAILSGSVKVGACTWIGAGATVVNNVEICAGSVIGAGAVVVKPIEKMGTYVGVPARKIK